jgi:2-C-methyl-D-erythritol 4-phosphate cytidylyltransferase
VTATLERSSLWAAQTPQAFRGESLRSALAGADLDRAYDDAQLVESAGGDVRIVEAPRENLKVTTPFDLQVAELLLSGGRR